MHFTYFLLISLFFAAWTSPSSAAKKNTENRFMNAAADYSVSNAWNGKDYNTNYSNLEYFDVYSEPIRTLYGQVHWRTHENITLPKDIVNRFSTPGKVMAVVGYEVDQIGMNHNYLGHAPDRRRVPITWSYNHHYGAFLQNSRTTKKIVFSKSPAARGNAADQPSMSLGHGSHVQVVLRDPKAKHKYSQCEFFSEGNGGEMRGSWHGYPKGYAQLIESPDTFVVIPMQIDTWDRDRMKRSAKYVPGAPLPKNSQGLVNASYNPLLECPCSDRLTKTWGMTYRIETKINDKNMCTGPVQNMTECIAAVQQVVPSSHWNARVISTPGYPYGCSVTVPNLLEAYDDDDKPASVTIVWNNYNEVDEKQNSVQTDRQRRQYLETFELPFTFDDEEESDGDSDPQQFVAFGHGVKDSIQVTVALDLTQDLAELTFQGPADRWFGVGFGADSMCLRFEADECPGGGPYTILFLENAVEERKLDFHGPGRVLERSLVVLSDHVDGETNQRTVVVRRSLKGSTADHFSFQIDANTENRVKAIMATGCGLDFAQHCGHGPSELLFFPAQQPVGVCQAGVQGTIGGNHFSERGRCPSQPTSDLAHQHNPTCTIQTYKGGLACCRDGESLLDMDQEQPWPDQPLEYRLKFRFYFQEYLEQTTETDSSSNTSPPSHKSLVRLYWQTENNAGEYDIPQCSPNTPPSHCVHVITSRWSVRDMFWGEKSNSTLIEGVELIYAAPHCHAGTCLSMELYNADTGQLLCNVEPIVGQDSTKPYQEEGYVSIPPCLWSNSDPNLPDPQPISLETNLLSIKKVNNTFPHTGEMASWQMRGITIPRQ